MTTLTVLYGSEASVLSTFVGNLEGIALKIYNTNKPRSSSRSWSCRVAEFSSVLDDVLSSEDMHQIRFLGAAFQNQSKLLASENNVDIASQIQTNIYNYVEVTKCLLPHMIKRKHGRFVYLGSVRAQHGGVGTSLYSGAKAFGEAFYKSVGQEYGRFNISAVVIRMGFFESRMLNDYDAHKTNALLKNIKNNRFGSPEDLASTIKLAFENEYLNTGVIELNGGLSAF